MRFIAAIAITSLLLGSSAAQAAVPTPVMRVMGADFLERCSNAPDKDVVAICAAYVAGIADEMKSNGQVCFGPRATIPGLLTASLDWLKKRSQNGGYPAITQIRTGLMTEFPCKLNKAVVQQNKLADAVEFGTNFAKFLKEVAPLVMKVLG